MNCQKCEARSAFGDGPCNDCKVTKPASLTETRNINGVQYYALKSAVKQEKPYWTEILK